MPSEKRITRWTVKGWDDDHVEFEDDDGKYVLYSDYIAALTAAEQAEPAWGDREDDLTDAIRDNHPFRTKRFDIYERAQQLVSNRHSKAALIELVSYLLVQAEPAPAARSGAVKQLEWQSIDDGMAFRAYLPIIGSIRIEPYGVCGWWEVLWSMPGQCDKLIPDVFDTADEAKAAAQADYERRVLTALEPAEPATDAEREFNEVLNEAEAFNAALPERMRRNARDWLRPDEEPAKDAEPVAWLMNGKGENWEERNVVTFDKETADMKAATEWWTVEPLYKSRPPESRYRKALEEIANLKTDRDRPDDYNRGFADGRWNAVNIARAALAQGADDGSA